MPPATTRVRHASTGRDALAVESPYLLVALGCVFTLTAGALVWVAVQGSVGLALTMGGILAVIAAWIAVPIERRRRRASAVHRWAVEHGWHQQPPEERWVLGGTEVLRAVVGGVPVTSCTTEYDPDWRRGGGHHAVPTPAHEHPPGGLPRPDDGPDRRGPPASVRSYRRS